MTNSFIKINMNIILGSHDFIPQVTYGNDGLRSLYNLCQMLHKTFYCNDVKITLCVWNHTRGSSTTYIIIHKLLVERVDNTMPMMGNDLLPAMAPAHVIHLIRDRSRNRLWNLWTFISGYPLYKWIAATWQKMRWYQDSGPNNGHQLTFYIKLNWKKYQ